MSPSIDARPIPELARHPRVRSVSMNNYMNGVGINIFSNNFVYNTRLSQILHPANSFVFLDERASTINDGYFVVVLTTNYSRIFLEDMPANYHNLAGGFSFADGHGETKKWMTALFQRAPTRRVPLLRRKIKITSG